MNLFYIYKYEEYINFLNYNKLKINNMMFYLVDLLKEIGDYHIEQYNLRKDYFF